MNAREILVAIVIAGLVTSGVAQDKAKTAEDEGFAKKLTDLGQVDLSVPESPAFAVLGISPSEIQRPGSARALAGSLVKGFDETGKAKTGVAIDFVPMLVFGRDNIRGGARYARDPLLQLFTRTSISLGTTEAGDDKGSKQAWGIRVGVFDFGDPGRHYAFLTSCLRGLTAASVPVPPGTDNIDGLTPDQEEAFKKAAAKCDPKVGLALWAEPALYVGFGESRYSSNERVTGTMPAAKAWWATYSQGMDRGRDGFRTLFMLHVSSRRDDRVTDPNDDTQLVRQDVRQVVGRLKLGKDNRHGFVDIGRKRVTLASSTTDKLRHFGFGAEFEIQKGMWLQIGSVRESGFADGTSRNVVTSGLRFGAEPLFTSPGD